MNWLAHTLLSEADIQSRMGNLLADVVKGRDRRSMPAGFQRGLVRHRRIDLYTDAHPRVRAAVGRLSVSGRYRRFAPILVDIVFDHFLASRWQALQPRVMHFDRDALPQTLPGYTGRVYHRMLVDDQRAAAVRNALPEHARSVLEQIAEHDLLASYADLAGVERALHGLSRRFERRWERTINLHFAMDEIGEHYVALGNDFDVFFPELVGLLTAEGKRRQPHLSVTPG